MGLLHRQEGERDQEKHCTDHAHHIDPVHRGGNSVEVILVQPFCLWAWQTAICAKVGRAKPTLEDYRKKRLAPVFSEKFVIA